MSKITKILSVHELWMKKAIGLAKKGDGKVPGRPLVGCVIVDNDNQEIGEGYFKKIGGPHAEVQALQKAGEKARGSTMYVTLEPHCFYGLTPPCTKSIIKAGIKKVFIAMIDPHSQVRGYGVEELKNAGIETEVGVLGKEVELLNKEWILKNT